MTKADEPENSAERTHVELSEIELRMLFDNMISQFSYYRMIYDAAGNPVDYVILAVNRAFEREIGASCDQVVGKNVRSIYPDTEQYWIECFGRVAQTGTPEQISNYSSALKKWYNVYAYSPKPGHVAVTVIDITPFVTQRESLTQTVQALKAQREENFRLVHEEPITGLPNRACLYDTFGKWMEAGEGKRFAVAIIIPDNLAGILGAYGSVFSDRIMSAIAQRLRTMFSNPDAFFSMTGTDLVFMISNPCDVQHTRKLLSSVLDAVRIPVEVDDAYFYISASCGVACYPADGDNREDLIMKANLALYQAKRDGHQIVFFSDQIGKSLLRRTRIRNALPKALEHQEFELYFQPQVQAQSDRLLGFEALLRWHSPDLGETSPLEFIGVAEESRLILPLGAWVLKNACMTLRQLNEQYHSNYFMAVNVSGIQLFADGFVEEVLAALTETGLAPGQLELEITESVLLNHERNTIQKLNTLFSHGIRIALDDFGTGFSSLSLLKDLKISTLKIDKSFVQDPKAAALMEMMVRLGHILGTETVAEGVETEEQMCYARRLGSERVQGYLTARPMPLSALRKFIESRVE